MRIQMRIVALTLLFAATSVFAQQGPQGGPPGAGPGGPGGPGGRGFDPEQMRQQMSDRMKKELGATDDEWKVLSPKIEKLVMLQMDSSGRALSVRLITGFDISSLMNGPDAKLSDVQRTANELYDAVTNTSTAPADLKAKLAAFVAAKAKAKAEMTKAQEDLRALLTARQEATMVMFGLLD